MIDTYVLASWRQGQSVLVDSMPPGGATDSPTVVSESPGPRRELRGVFMEEKYLFSIAPDAGKGGEVAGVFLAEKHS